VVVSRRKVHPAEGNSSGCEIIFVSADQFTETKINTMSRKHSFGVAVLCFLMAACGQNGHYVQAVHADSTPSMTCEPVMVLAGDDGHSSSLKLQAGPCTVAGTGAGSSKQSVAFTTEDNYTLKNALTVCEVKSWIGTSARSVLETGMEWTVVLPDGTFLWDFPNQYDKHTDIVGSHWMDFTTPSGKGKCSRLPAGTLFHFKQVTGITDPQTDCPIYCGTHNVLFLNGPGPEN